MFDTKNTHLLHKNAVKLVMKHLPGAIDMDSVTGYYAPYDIDWNNIKIIVKVAKPSKKATQKKAKWFYTLKERDHQIADYFVLFTLLKNKQIGAIYVLPRPFVPTACITITKLDGTMRYDYFKTELQNLADRVMDIEKRLPKLIKIYRKAMPVR